MITTDAAVREVCVVKGDRAREMSEAGDKSKREKRQAAAYRAKKIKTEMTRETVGGGGG